MQDAVTPLWQPKVTLFIWGAVLVVLVTSFFRFGFVVGSLLIVWFLLVSTIVGIAFIPKPESSHYLGIIVSSLTSRMADFRRTEINFVRRPRRRRFL